jgi:putative peptidoglycan lipid II flippase
VTGHTDGNTGAHTDARDGAHRGMPADRGILANSAVMAVGTVFSRLSGVIRSLLLAAALGTGVHADVFNIANTIPNMLYILLAGGVFNAVLVPQLVRAMTSDADRGQAYTNRIITLAGLFLAGVSAVLVVAAPLLMRILLDGSFFTPELAAQRESAIAFARYCLPQVFFYGMFVLVGQILNARGRFGPMMWAPIANNVISILVLGMYFLVFGAAVDVCQPHSGVVAPHNSVLGPFSDGQLLLLGLGSTFGILVQFLVLLPYLRATGYRYTPQFDFRGTGLGHTLRLGVWTVLFVVVNQIAYTIVIRIASSGTANAATASCGHSAGPGSGYTIYAGAFLIVMVPHSVATVSLATAALPRLSGLAVEHDLRGVGREVASTLRTALAMIIPFALLLPVVALPLVSLVYAYGAARNSAPAFALALALFAPGLVFFTCHYLVLRGFYAVERNRTVFWVQCLIAATNIGLAIAITRSAPPTQAAPGLVMAYGGSYLVGAATSYLLLRRILGGLDSGVLLRFLVRIVLAGGIAALAALGLRLFAEQAWPEPSRLQSVALLVGCGLLDLALLLGLARAMRITEVNEVVALFTRRLRRRRRLG